jgi:succinate-semialdehyde dehydrogenase / glutarate-semialdehyde dehydrogenase
MAESMDDSKGPPVSNAVDTLLPGREPGLLIGGDWTEASDRIEVIDPATEDTLAEVAAAGEAEATAAVDAAAAAAPAWAATAPRERGEVLRRAFEMMIDRAEELAELIVLENGKAFSDALGEVRYGAEFLRWFSEEAARVGGENRTAPAGDKTILTRAEPVGISVLITPWNFPAAMATRKIGPALAAGCTTVLKPASDTPLTALALGDILRQAGAPAGVVNVIPARGSSGVVEHVLADPRVRKVSFTGSTEVGRHLMEVAAQRILRSSMELGGNAPFIVFADADIDGAVDGAMIAKMRNGGEACTAANRFLVEAPVAEEFTRALANRMGALRMGPGIDRDNQLGPMINERSRRGIADLVDGAVDRGAAVAVGGEVPDRTGYFYPATVLSSVEQGDPILSTEIFGPVAPVVQFASEDEAIALANDTEYGLISYLYSGDTGKALRVAEALEAGMVGINRGLVSDPGAPFGGVKQSGVGREGGREGVLEYLETKYIAVSW